MQVNWEKIMPALFGAAGGAIILAIIGFAWGGWVTGGTAQKMAEEMAEDAVVGRLAPICVEQYNQDSEKVRKLEELKAESSWKRKNYVEKQGWATIPGQTNPDRNVAEKCAEMLLQLG
jgi:hypothetical protein